MLEQLAVVEKEINISNVYYVDKYDELCEQHFKIEKIVPLRQPRWKYIMNICLNFTIVIFYIYGFSRKIEKFMKYDECTLEEAEILGIYCKDGKFYLIELKKINLPNVKNPDILTSELNYSRECFLFTFKLFTYVFNPSTNAFNSIKYSIFHTKEDIYKYMSNGLTEEEHEYQHLIYGDCDLSFEINPFIRELFLNTCNFFFLFQVYSITLWMCTEYYQYASLILVLTIFDLFEQTFTTLSNLKSIRKMARYSIKIKIYKKIRNNEIKIIEEESANLVPGDIFELPEGECALPCDCILLSGSVIINEAMLTGESTPIIKTHLPNTKQNFDPENDAKYFLFAGTKIVQKRKENKQPVIALCFSTGFNSIKGNLIRSILYPVEGESKFANESIKFIAFMGILCVVGFFSVLPFKIKKIEDLESPSEKKEAIKEIIKQGFDLITTAIPPTLPCCLGVGIGIAQRRIKQKNIMCINRNKITSAGKISVCVFDKTGTLTEDHLNIAGFLPVEAHTKQNDKKDNKENINNYSHNYFVFDQFYNSMKELSEQNFKYYKEKIKDPSKKSKKNELKQLFIECLACCQGITKVDGKLMGDPIDVEMFESTGWNLIEETDDPQNYDPRISAFVRPSQEKSLTDKLRNAKNSDNINNNNEYINSQTLDHYEIGIIRRFDFSSKLQRMSTLAKNLTETNYMCYCKGSPEKIKELCMPKTLPDNFNDELNNYTSKGYRVLALASKVIQMNSSEALEVSRSFCEKDLIFLGLLIVQNKLKEATSGTLKELTEKGNVKVKMATGDNIMTAVCVARKCNLIDPESIVYSCEIEKEENQDENKKDEIVLDNKQNERTGLNIYDNNILMEREKENIKKKLVWKTIESFKEEEDENLTKEEKALNDLRNNEILSRPTFNANLSFMVPQEVTEDDIGEEDVNNLIKSKNEKNTKNKEEEELEENIEIDLSSLPFDKKNDEANIQIAITGKTFETLYRMNQKYEKAMNINKNNLHEGIETISGIYDNSQIDDENNNIKINNNKDYENEDINKILSYKQFHEAFRLILRHCSIYARCSPENKTQIVQSLQKESFTVLMCGDGANDCGALKVADVGISLSTEEASIAAPFTSHTPDISCVIQVLIEGKCALVTSFQIFKFILLYSMIQFISVTFLILLDSCLSDWQYMASDLFLITPLAFLMPLTHSNDKLTFHKPVSSLFSFSIIFSMMMQTICVAVFQLGGYFLMDSFFPPEDEEFKTKFCSIKETLGNKTIFKTPLLNLTKCEKQNFRICDSDITKSKINCIDNSANFYISFAQYLILCIVFAKGKPFKQNIFKNFYLLSFSIIMFIYAEYIVFFVDYFSNIKLSIIPFPDDSFFYKKPVYINGPEESIIQFKFYIMFIIVLNFLVSLLIEKILVSKCNKWWRKKRMYYLQNKIENDTENEADLNMINTVKNYIKEKKMK